MPQCILGIIYFLYNILKSNHPPSHPYSSVSICLSLSLTVCVSLSFFVQVLLQTSMLLLTIQKRHRHCVKPEMLLSFTSQYPLTPTNTVFSAMYPVHSACCNRLLRQYNTTYQLELPVGTDYNKYNTTGLVVRMRHSDIFTDQFTLLTCMKVCRAGTACSKLWTKIVHRQNSLLLLLCQ